MGLTDYGRATPREPDQPLRAGSRAADDADEAESGSLALSMSGQGLPQHLELPISGEQLIVDGHLSVLSQVEDHVPMQRGLILAA